ncbi:radical SAM protein [soil metagenome]
MKSGLLANSYFYKLDSKQWKFKQPYPPLGTLQAAAIVRNCGFETAVFDVSLLDSPEEIESVLKNINPDYLVLYDDGFNYLTKMCLTVMREAAFKMATIGKEYGCTVIINSSDSTDHIEKYFDHGVDYVIRGEGEKTLEELLFCLEQGNDLSLITSVAFKTPERTIVTKAKEVIKKLDDLPLPAWDLIDLSPYKSIWKKHHGYFSLNIATTRGCPYKCNWCAKPIYGNRYNSRSTEHVVREIELLLTNYQPDHFWMCDDIFGLKPGWITQFRDLVKEKKLAFKYKIQSRVDLIVEKDIAQSLAESGCETVWLGAESGSQKILDAMDKGTTLSEIHNASQSLKSHGVNVGFFLQFGYPGETRNDIDATINMVLKEMPNEIGVSISYPLPGTKFYENVKTQLRDKQNWTDSDDLAMLYENDFPIAFYRILQRYIHSRHRIQRGINLLKGFIKKPAFQYKDVRKMASMFYHIPLSILQSYRLKRLSQHNG